MLLLLLPFFSTLCIIMNIYNGGILGINEHNEYLLWYFPLIIYLIYEIINEEKQIIRLIPELILSLLAIFINIYCRHYKEYYDFQSLLFSLTFILLLNNYNYNKYSIKNKIILI